MNISDLNYMEAASSDVTGGILNTFNISKKKAYVTQVGIAIAPGFQVGNGPNVNYAKNTNTSILVQAL